MYRRCALLGKAIAADPADQVGAARFGVRKGSYFPARVPLLWRLTGNLKLFFPHDNAPYMVVMGSTSYR